MMPDSAYLVHLLENFAIERGIYGKRWLDPQYFELNQFRKMGIRPNDPLTEEETATFERVIDLKRKCLINC